MVSNKGTHRSGEEVKVLESFFIMPSMKRQLNKAADRLGKSKGELIRTAIEAYLESHNLIIPEASDDNRSYELLP